LTLLITNDRVYEAIADRSSIQVTLSLILPALFQIALLDNLTLDDYEKVDALIRAQVH
jgi:hypothetical protein